MQEISRRSLLIGGGVLAAASLAEVGSAAGEGTGHGHHHGAAPHQALIDAALDCLAKSELCIQHCLALIRQGDTSLADCLTTTQPLVAMCETLAKLGALESRHLVAYANLCISFCEDCEKECREHENEHARCKACAESCAACISECRKLVG